ncbi:hypothetical protein MKX01_000326 [Papaver californicum]|nr:hypothetical protein MKX01_000326 [Papaver californicum]
MYKDRRRSQQRKPKRGIRIEEKKWVVKPYNEDNQSLTLQQQLNIIPISEFIQPSSSLESAGKHPKSNEFDPNQQPRVIEKTESEEGFSVFNKEEEEEVRESEKSKDEVDDILKPKLSEEQLEVNDKLQEEEILAMEAIYGENVIVLDREDGLRSFKYVPPIALTCLPPKVYPTHSAPFFTISVQWLDAMTISNLCRMLDTIWTGQSGQEIVYPWVDWLQNSSLSYLEFDNGIESVSPDVDIPLILNYNDDKCNVKFRQNLHERCICLSEYAGIKFVSLPCKHFFCRNCLETYLTMHAKEVPPGLFKRMLGVKFFEQWESLLFHKTLESLSDLVYCPRCEMACLEDEDHLAQCPKDRLHVGVQCMTSEEKLKLLQNRQPVMKTRELTKQQRKEMDMINQLYNEEGIKRIAKQCPTCLMAISRTEGCNHMRCSRCGQDFCYKCGEAYDKGTYYCNSNCGLFDRDRRQELQAERLQREAVLLHKERQLLSQRLAEDPANHAHSCPICRQMNAKVQNNNHIFCWSCQQHYCYLCQNIVKRSSQHYGPKGCKQHSAG